MDTPETMTQNVRRERRMVDLSANLEWCMSQTHAKQSQADSVALETINAIRHTWPVDLTADDLAAFRCAIRRAVHRVASDVLRADGFHVS